MPWHCFGMTQYTFTSNSIQNWAETSPVGKGTHALPFLCKACYGMTQKPLPTNSFKVWAEKSPLLYLRKACFGIALRMTQKVLT
jgi:hypothetical protein